MVIDRERLAQFGVARGRAARVRLGAARHPQLPAADFRLRDACRWPQRIAEARKLLAAAGYSRDKPLNFELRYNNGEVHTKVAVAVASMWKEALGVEAQPRRAWNSSR